MKKLALSIVASACLLFGLSTPAHAAYSYSAGCNSGWFFYIHAPYPIGGGLQAWGDCVPNGTAINWPDAGLPAGSRVDQIYSMYATDGQHFTPVGYNYESWRTIPNWGKTVIAAACTGNAAYWMTRVAYWSAPNTVVWKDTSAVWRLATCP